MGAECGENNEIKDNEVAGTMANIESAEDEDEKAGERKQASKRQRRASESKNRRREPACTHIHTRDGILRVPKGKGLIRRQGGTGRALVRRTKCSGRVPITFIIFSHQSGVRLSM